MNFMFVPSKQTCKPKNFLGNKHAKTQKIQLENKIINLKATIFSNPNKIIKSQSPKVRNQSKNTTQPTQYIYIYIYILKKILKNLKPKKTHLKQVEPSISNKPTSSKSNLANPPQAMIID